MHLVRRHRDPKLDWLRSIAPLRALPVGELRALAAIADRAQLAAGTVLASQGRLGGELFVIVSGEVEVRRDGVALARLGPGSTVGELALLGGTHRSADVVAITDVEAAVFGRRAFEQAMARSAGFRRTVERAGVGHVPA